MADKKSGGTFIPRELSESPAYIALSGFAPQLLVLIFNKRIFQQHGRKGKDKRVCINADAINITYTEFKTKFGVPHPRLTRGIDQLLEKGFIEIAHYGGAFRKDKSVFALSDKWRIWQPGTCFQTRPSVVKKGYQNHRKKITANETVPIHTNETVPITAN